MCVLIQDEPMIEKVDIIRLPIVLKHLFSFREIPRRSRFRVSATPAPTEIP